MGKIKLTNTGAVIPVGTHIFKITVVEYKEDFGKLEIKMQTADGSVHTERFTFLKKSGEQNIGALNAFSYFAKIALNDFSVAEIDPSELIGRYIECDVDHEEVPARDDPDKTVIFTRLKDKRPADGYANEARPAAAPSGMQEISGTVDLDAILGI